MDKKNSPATPSTLLDAVRYFSDPDICIAFMAELRWPDGNPTCPTCGSQQVKYLREYRRWQCHAKHPKRQFSIKVGTIFEDSPIALEKWLPAVWLLCNDKNGISSYEVARALGITQKSAWFMMHRIRRAMETGTFTKLRGQIEADETFIGGKVRNMHKWRKAKVMEGRKGGSYSKAVVMGLLERHGEGRSKVRAAVLAKAVNPAMRQMIDQHVEPGSEMLTDDASSYRSLSPTFVHNFINHVETYVRGHVHTNGIENFWSLLKRSLRGTYVNVEPFHLHRYVDEQVFRFNERFGKDADRFVKAMRGIVGKRLTYRALRTSLA